MARGDPLVSSDQEQSGLYKVFAKIAGVRSSRLDVGICCPQAPAGFAGARSAVSHALTESVRMHLPVTSRVAPCARWRASRVVLFTLATLIGSSPSALAQAPLLPRTLP